MKVAQVLESRRAQWRTLEELCDQVGKPGRMSAATVTRFAALYRAACADLALADAYHLPPATVRYLHQLVARAHNQLYRSRPFRLSTWFHELFLMVPQQLRADRFLPLAMAIFWGVFLLAAGLSYRNREFTVAVAGESTIQRIEEMYAKPVSGRGANEGAAMSGFYIYNNPSIGLRCFAFGLIFGIGGLFATIYNAAFLGALFGHMATVPQAGNFFHFVTAHGPFELTGVVLSAAAGMRLGFSLVDTRGRTKGDALRRTAQQCVPIMSCAVLLFVLAAGIEAFLSPSSAPYAAKVAVAVLSTLMMLFYYFFLGRTGREAKT
jgi:uncharacterized membrane protein SpoIIM required for sporulation